MPNPSQSPTLSSVLEENARRHADKIATVCRGVRLTYRELAERVDRLADALAAQGFGPGDRLLWMGQNSHRALECILATGHLGGMACPINWRQSAAEQAAVLDYIDPKVVVWQEETTGPVIAAAREQASVDALWLQHDGVGEDSYEAFIARDVPRRPRHEVSDDDPVLMICTAAFAGEPNAAMLTHRNILVQAPIMAYLQEIGPDTIWLSAGPMFHIGCLITTFPTFIYGGTNVFTYATDAEEVCEAIATERCTDGYVLPPMLPKMLAVIAEKGYDVSCLRSSIEHPEWNALTRPDTSHWGAQLSFYGQTEIGGIVTHAAFGGGRPGLGTAGKPTPYAQIRIVDDEGNEVPTGEVGEIVVRGPMVGKGFWNRPEINAHRTRTGWWHTYDLGKIEEDGSVLFIGPKARLLKSGNENIYPAEVERCLTSHPAIAEAAIIGVPHEKWTQSPKAIIVLAEGQTLTADEVIEWCRQHLAGYKRPHFVEFVDSLPRVNGQIDYDTLDERFGGGGYPGGATRVR
jgi:acyl-CoA synthetase (AMP-forming)/AMP-acid ligase II